MNSRGETSLFDEETLVSINATQQPVAIAYIEHAVLDHLLKE